MLEIPEAIVLADQINQTVIGKTITHTIAAASPHKLAWFFEDPEHYPNLLNGKKLEHASAYGGRVEIEAQGAIIHIGDGVGLRYHAAGEKRPVKHQLLIEFDDKTAISAIVAMYGGIWCFPEGAFDNFYYQVAKEKPPVLSDLFDVEYYLSLFNEATLKLSAKAFLATEQRIPGLGNGVVQDILLNAKIHPKTKMNTLTDKQIETLFHSIKDTVKEMAADGGRDTERDFFGNPGGYMTKLSKNSLLLPCRNCGGHIKKETFLGGSIYYCQECQKLS